MTAITTVSGYSFVPDDLRSAERKPGLSAFMRTRNGAAFLEVTIRSHIDHFDEFVVVYNRCEDDTGDILARLVNEFGPKLKGFHYTDSVFPPGSEGHRLEPPNSPRSFVNYSNFALARTTRRIVTKVDDDHLAIEPALAEICADLRAGRYSEREMLCFSGPNLARDEDGHVGVLAREPFSGTGDVGFFHALPGAFYSWDPRFEHFNKYGVKRRFAGFLYWHLKYLKPEFGFANYDLEENPESRYVRKRAAFLHDRRVLDLDALRRTVHVREKFLALLSAAGVAMPDKARMRADRWRAFQRAFRHTTLSEALAEASPTSRLLPVDPPHLADAAE